MNASAFSFPQVKLVVVIDKENSTLGMRVEFLLLYRKNVLTLKLISDKIVL